MNRDENLLPSQTLKMFLDFIEDAKSAYNYSLEAMKNEEHITQDYLHMLELDDLSYHERGKAATELAQNRRNRRKHKDAVEEYEPIVNFFEDPQNKMFVNKLSGLLGQVRKVENYHQRRFYIPKAVNNESEKNYCETEPTIKIS